MKYYCPSTLSEYFECLNTIGSSQVSILSGGTDLMPRYEQGMPWPENIIDIKKLAELRGITEDGGRVAIGALTSMETLKQSSLIRSHFPALWMAANDFAGVQIRNRATLGGNICNASPAGDTLPPLYVYNAKLKLVNNKSTRTLPVAEFITGPGQVALQPGELLHSVILPKQSSESVFYKLGLRPAMAIAVVNFALSYRIDSGKLTDMSVAAGAVAPTVVLLDSFSRVLLEDSAALDDAVDQIDKDIAPVSDIRATADYRRQALKNMLRFYVGHELHKWRELERRI